ERKASGVAAYKRSLVSFKGGMKTLPDTLAASLGESLQCGANVTSIEQGAGCWTVRWERAGESCVESARKLVIAVPAYALASLPLPEALHDALAPLDSLPYSPVSTVFTGYRREDVAHALDGFGVLVPRKECRGVIGTLFLSSLFEGRAPEGHVALLSFVGGMYSQRHATMPAHAQIALVREELGRILGVSGAPVVEQAHFWPKAIPNFPVGFQSALDTLDAVEGRWSNLAIVGNYRGGPAAGDSLVNATQRAATLLERD
ncbi:MAG: protoporphyrinogen oxidase, partial [Opitutales bacterium]|nr:protoporphyrinogen oxidase [Opitutales bacterium]